MRLWSWLIGNDVSKQPAGPLSSKDEQRQFKHADDLMEKGRDEEARPILESLKYSLDPDLADRARNFLADIHTAAGRLIEAEQELRHSLDYRIAKGDDSTAHLYAVLGVVLERMGRVDDAEAAYAKALDGLRGKDPEMTVFVLRNVETLLDRLGRKDEANEIESRLPEYDEDLYADLEAWLAPYVDRV